VRAHSSVLHLKMYVCVETDRGRGEPVHRCFRVDWWFNQGGCLECLCHVCASVIKQYKLVSVKGQWCSVAVKVTAGPAIVMATCRWVCDLSPVNPTIDIQVCDYLYLFKLKKKRKSLYHRKSTSALSFFLDAVFSFNILSSRQRLVSIGRHAGFDWLLSLLYAIIEHPEERVWLLLISQTPVEWFLSTKARQPICSWRQFYQHSL